MEHKLDENHLKQEYNIKHENIRKKQVEMKFKIKNQRK